MFFRILTVVMWLQHGAVFGLDGEQTARPLVVGSDVEAIQGVATTYPAVVPVQLGIVPYGEETFRWVEVENLTGEPFVAERTETDCGCAVGFVEGKLTAPNGIVRVYVKAKPGSTGAFKRTVTVAGPKGSDRNIILRLDATARPRYEITPSELRVRPRSSDIYELSVSANFGSQFDESVRPELDENSLFKLEVGRRAKDHCDIRLSLRNDQPATDVFLKPLIERICFRNSDGTKLSINVPLVWEKPPKIIPSSVRVGKGASRFFVVGDFGHSLEDLKRSVFYLMCKSEKFDVEVNWKNTTSCVCSATIRGSLVEEEVPAELWFAVQDGVPVRIGDVMLVNR